VSLKELAEHQIEIGKNKYLKLMLILILTKNSSTIKVLLKLEENPERLFSQASTSN
jgi:N utilization substance protein B